MHDGSNCHHDSSSCVPCGDRKWRWWGTMMERMKLTMKAKKKRKGADASLVQWP